MCSPELIVFIHAFMLHILKIDLNYNQTRLYSIPVSFAFSGVQVYRGYIDTFERTFSYLISE